MQSQSVSILAFLFFVLVISEVRSQNSAHVTLSCGNDVTSEKGEPGQAGKKGPVGERGMEGPKGAKGEHGLCDPSCRSAYNQLSEKVRRLESTMKILGLPKSCKTALQLGHNESGIYRIHNPRNQQLLEVYCDQTTDNGGWMVIQRRTDGSENFYRTWAEYQEKFGNLSNEFWLGLTNLHALTRTGGYELRIELEDCANIRKFAKFSSFSIGSVEQSYSLTISGYSGNAGDSLNYHNGRAFTTKDVDNDSSRANCAVLHHGAWWYGDCHHSNLNGAYLNCQTTNTQAASWGSFHGNQYSLKFIEMKFRPI